MRASATGARWGHSGGTLFLDEITQLPPEQQRLLANALETHTFRRVGGTHDIQADLRLMAATSDDVQQALNDGRLREDLYRLLDTYLLPIPPLRQRADDVELLARHFVDLLNEREFAQKRLGYSALRAFTEYPWPGNVQELRAVVENAYGQADGNTIDALDLPNSDNAHGRGLHTSTIEISVGMPLDEVEEQLIRATLEAVGGTRHRAASMLGISPKTLYNKLQKMKIS